MEQSCRRGGGGRGGPIKISPSSFDGGEQQLGLGVDCLEPSASTDSLTASLGLGDRMPFLQMLQTSDPSNIHSPSKKTENHILEVDSCLTHDMSELHSPVMSEDKNPTRASPDGTLEEKGELNSVNECRQDSGSDRVYQSKPLLSCGKMRKPKRTKAGVVNDMDKEKQRMTHIAVERNRRRQMSEYLSVLRSFLPPAYAEKGDQASIVGGAIDYVKKLEQLLQSLQAQKRQRKMTDEMRRSSNSIPTTPPETSVGISTSASSSSSALSLDEKNLQLGKKKADINIRVVQTHVNLHIECDDHVKQSQLIKLLIALEELGLTILHLNITSRHESSFYSSLSLKVEDECKVRSADEIRGSIEKVVNSINIYNGRRSSVRN